MSRFVFRILLILLAFIFLTAGCTDNFTAAQREALLKDVGSIYDFEVKNIDGESVKLEEFEGKVVLIVNVASKCGFTPQYEGLQALYEKYQPDVHLLCKLYMRSFYCSSI